MSEGPEYGLDWFFSSFTAPEGMPPGEDGKTIWDRSKQTPQQYLECLQRGATDQ